MTASTRYSTGELFGTREHEPGLKSAGKASMSEEIEGRDGVPCAPIELRCRWCGGVWMLEAKGMRVLVAEDDPVSRIILETRLTKMELRGCPR